MVSPPLTRRGPAVLTRTVIALGSASLLAGCSPSPAVPRAANQTSAERVVPTVTSESAGPAPPPSEAPARSAVVVLDPGHNGGNASAPAEINRPVPAGGFTKPCNTVGAATDAGYTEHEFTFDVARRAADVLRARGVTVLLTRADDAGVGPCVNVRAAVANDARADVALSIHADGAPAGDRGFHVIEPAVAPDGGNAAILPASHEAASDLRAAFVAASGGVPATYPGGLVAPGLTRRSDLAGLNLARVPAAFIECANMRNPADAAAVMDPEWRQRAARGIADGLLAYLGSR